MAYSGLSTARLTDKGYFFALFNLKADIFKHIGFIFPVRKGDIFKFYFALDIFYIPCSVIFLFGLFFHNL